MEHTTGSLIIRLAKVFDIIGMFQFVNRADIVFADDRIQLGKVVINTLSHLTVEVIEWQLVFS